VITVLARWAGFSKEEAGTIAYNSQFVDELYFNGEIVFEREHGRPPYAYTFRQTVKQTATSPQMLYNLVDLTNRDKYFK
jgi:hypothetical protein